MILKRLLFFATALTFLVSSLQAQVGGSAVYSFLDVPASARVAALGGTFISVKDDDINNAMQNPALLNPSMQKHLSFSGVSYFDKVKFGDAAYAFKLKDWGTFLTAMHYAHYGDFTETNESGEVLGTFQASDMALLIGYSKQLNKRFSIGSTLKVIYSDFYLYNSFGLAADIGGTYYDSANQVTVSVVGRNIGAQLDGYVNGNSEPLPIEIQAAISKRLAHVPFRFNLTARHLENFDITYIDPEDPANFDPITGDQNIQEISFGEKLARHFIVGGELLFSQHFHLRVAYNFQRRREMLVETAKQTVGFSWGFGMRISKFQIGYGRASYHVYGGSNHFTITTNLADFYSKKTPPANQ